MAMDQILISINYLDFEEFCIDEAAEIAQTIMEY